MEIKVFKHFILGLLAVSSLASCLRDEPVIIDNGDDQQVTTYTLGTPVDYATKLEGLSAICLNEAGDGLLVAEDNGHVYEFGLDGNLKKTNAMPNPDGRSKVDLEGIAKASDGSIFLCEERFREVWKLSADHKSMTLISKGPEEAGSEENQGYEGIAAGPDGILYIANQSKPFRVYTYSTASKAWATAFDVDWAQSLSDIYYDNEDKTLWITDAKTQKLTQVKTDGTKLQEISISFVKKPEGFCKDAKNKTFWFICDSTSKLYSVTYN